MASGFLELLFKSGVPFINDKGETEFGEIYLKNSGCMSMLVARIGTRELGALVFNRSPGYVGIATIDNTTIGTAERVHKVGTQLIGAVAAIALKENSKIYLIAESSHGFYLKLGFEALVHPDVPSITIALTEIKERKTPASEHIFSVASSVIEAVHGIFSADIEDTDHLLSLWLWDGIGPVQTEKVQALVDKSIEDGIDSKELVGSVTMVLTTDKMKRLAKK